MSKPVIYLNGPISDIPLEDAVLWRKYIIAASGGANGNYNFLDPTVFPIWDRDRHDTSEAKALVLKYQGYIDQSSAVISKMNVPSIGTSMTLYYAYITGKPTITICRKNQSPFLHYYSWAIASDEDEALVLLDLIFPSIAQSYRPPRSRNPELGWSKHDIFTLVMYDTKDSLQLSSSPTQPGHLFKQGDILRDFYTSLDTTTNGTTDVTWEAQYSALHAVYEKYSLSLTRLNALNDEGYYGDEHQRLTLQDQLRQSEIRRIEIENELVHISQLSISQLNQLDNLLYERTCELNRLTKAPNSEDTIILSPAKILLQSGITSILIISPNASHKGRLEIWLEDCDINVEQANIEYSECEKWIHTLKSKHKIADLVIYIWSDLRHIEDFKAKLATKCNEIISAATWSQVEMHLAKRIG